MLHWNWWMRESAAFHRDNQDKMRICWDAVSFHTTTFICKLKWTQCFCNSLDRTAVAICLEHVWFPSIIFAFGAAWKVLWNERIQRYIYKFQTVSRNFNRRNIEEEYFALIPNKDFKLTWVPLLSFDHLFKWNKLSQ